MIRSLVKFLALLVIPSLLTQKSVLAVPLLHKKNQQCDPSGTEWTAYSGIRISHEVLLRINHQITTSQLYRLHEEYFSNSHTLAKIELTDSRDLFFNIDHNMILTKCDYGDISAQVSVPLGPKIDIPWNQTVCTSTQCYRLSRRKRFLNRKAMLHLPGTLVGGIFEEHDEAWKPLLPLFVETPFQSWTQLQFGSSFKKWHVTNISEVALSHRIPLLYTPDILDRSYPRSLHWTKYIDPNERYNEFVDPRKLRNIAFDWLSKNIGNGVEHKVSNYIANVPQKKDKRMRSRYV